MTAALIRMKLEADLPSGTTLDLLDFDAETGDDEECSPTRAIDLVIKAIEDSKASMATTVSEELAKEGVACGG